MMYLMLSVAGHMTIFLTRTRGPFWSIRPAPILLDSRARHANSGNVDCSIWIPHATSWLGLGRIRMGICR